MKVLVVTNMYPTEKHPFYGIFVKEQVESLTKEGVFLDVVFINGKESKLNYFTAVMTLLKKLKSTHYSVIHAHHTYCVFPVLITKLLTGSGAPLILTFHEGEVYKPKEVILADVDVVKRLVFSKKLKKAALKIADLVITVEKGLTKALNFDGETVILPCGVDLDLFQPMEKVWCRKKLNFPMDKKIIFFPAAPEKKTKGLDILNEALKYLSRKNISLFTGGSILHQDVPYYMCASDVVAQI